MAVRVAVASSDGKVINQHFGRARQFLIFNITGEKYEFVEIRENTPPCQDGEHHEEAMNKSAELIADCRMVLVNNIGPVAAAILEGKGIRPYALTGFIDKVLEKLVSSPLGMTK